MRPGGRSDADPLTGRPCLSAGRKDRPARMKAVHALQYRCRVKGIRDVSDKMPGPRARKRRNSPKGRHEGIPAEEIPQEHGRPVTIWRGRYAENACLSTALPG